MKLSLARPVLLVRLLASAGLAALLLAGAAGAAGRSLTRHPRHRHRRPHHHAHHASAPRSRAAAGGCADTRLPATSADVAAMRAAVLCLVNAERTAHGLPALRGDRRLDRSAQGWTAAMVSSGQFTHGADFAARITAAGLRWSAAGENIATGFPTPGAVMSAWMASPEHCRNILDPDFAALGVGVVPRPVRVFASGAATWTQDFALPLGASAPSHNRGPAAGCPY